MEQYSEKRMNDGIDYLRGLVVDHWRAINEAAEVVRFNAMMGTCIIVLDLSAADDIDRGWAAMFMTRRSGNVAVGPASHGRVEKFLELSSCPDHEEVLAALTDQVGYPCVHVLVYSSVVRGVLATHVACPATQLQVIAHDGRDYIDPERRIVTAATVTPAARPPRPRHGFGATSSGGCA